MKPLLNYNNVSKLKFKDIRFLFSIFVEGEDTLIHSTSQEDHEDVNGYNLYVWRLLNHICVSGQWKVSVNFVIYHSCGIRVKQWSLHFRN